MFLRIITLFYFYTILWGTIKKGRHFPVWPLDLLFYLDKNTFDREIKFSNLTSAMLIWFMKLVLTPTRSFCCFGCFHPVCPCLYPNVLPSLIKWLLNQLQLITPFLPDILYPCCIPYPLSFFKVLIQSTTLVTVVHLQTSLLWRSLQFLSNIKAQFSFETSGFNIWLGTRLWRLRLTCQWSELITMLIPWTLLLETSVFLSL